MHWEMYSETTNRGNFYIGELKNGHITNTTLCSTQRMVKTETKPFQNDPCNNGLGLETAI